MNTEIKKTKLSEVKSGQVFVKNTEEKPMRIYRFLYKYRRQYIYESLYGTRFSTERNLTIFI